MTRCRGDRFCRGRCCKPPFPGTQMSAIAADEHQAMRAQMAVAALTLGGVFAVPLIVAGMLLKR